MANNNLLQYGHGEDAGVGLDNSNNDSKDAQRRGENFHDENLDKKTRVLRITNRTGRPGNTNRNSRSYVRQTDRKTCREHAVSSIVISSPVPVFVQVKSIVFGLLNFVGQDNGHDNTINSRGLAENNTVLWYQKEKQKSHR